MGASCTKSKDDTGVEATTTLPPKTTTTPDQAAEAAVRKLGESWAKNVRRIAKDPNPADPAIAQHLTGTFLTNFKANQGQRQREGLLSRPATPSRGFYRIDSVEVRGSTATLHECVLDDNILYKKATGETLDDDVQSTEFRSAARREGDVWKLSDRVVVKEWDGVAGCAKRN
jgi:hypothetical protein